MYLRETKRRNADGSTVSYLALAQNERDPQTGVPRARIIHRFGRADQVDRDALGRLVRSISRFLDPGEAVQVTASGEVQIIESRTMGSAWLADRLWERLEIGKTIIGAAAGRRFDAERVERAIFAMVSNRLSVKPLSKLAGCDWVAERAFVEGLAEVSDDECYRAMDFRESGSQPRVQPPGGERELDGEQPSTQTTLGRGVGRGLQEIIVDDVQPNQRHRRAEVPRRLADAEVRPDMRQSKRFDEGAGLHEISVHQGRSVDTVAGVGCPPDVGLLTWLPLRRVSVTIGVVMTAGSRWWSSHDRRTRTRGSRRLHRRPNGQPRTRARLDRATRLARAPATGRSTSLAAVVPRGTVDLLDAGFDKLLGD